MNPAVRWCCSAPVTASTSAAISIRSCGHRYRLPTSRSSMRGSVRCVASGSICRTAPRGDEMTVTGKVRGRLAAALVAMLAAAGLTGVRAAEITHVDGYAVDRDVLCGTAPDAYPKLRIGMREGYCAGLVADKDDGLIFPRTIVQIPGHREFVVADMGSWTPAHGRLLLLDPAQPAGKRI